MKVDKINSNFAVGEPALHFEGYEGWLWESESPFINTLFTIYMNNLKDWEVDILLNSPIELSVYEKIKNDEHYLIPLLKIGSEEKPFLFSCPFDPTAPKNKDLVTNGINSKLMVFAIIDDSEKVKLNCTSFKAFRILSIPDDIQLYVGDYFVGAIEQGESWSMEHFAWAEETSRLVSLEEMWMNSRKLGVGGVKGKHKKMIKESVRHSFYFGSKRCSSNN